MEIKLLAETNCRGEVVLFSAFGALKYYEK